ncbi:hypothetical protein LPJ64_003946 [Coemansia asiatica]|uniref:tRNA (adenine(58)-N(1))-methyltransferase catalytic subunit TRM61 n=1 Tax=Coemansia asiatica TaxID=1052880 RepID=A0A9W7XH17_9FUNG|nr:hypothetical protein LPJ64_003946 [Coemansia asiatica]KAJ2882605.1 hypothetical protein FB639_002351 [Coemansia asiatica]
MVHRPTLSSYVLNVPRKCTPIYPKDSAAIIELLDVSPGDQLLEAGTGNGGLTMYLARAIGSSGHLCTVDRNPEVTEHAKKIVAGFDRGQLLPQITFYSGSVGAIVRNLYMPENNALDTQEKDNLIRPVFDGVVLDMPTPWDELPLLYGFLKTDRFAVCYLPNMSQVIELVTRCRKWPLLVENVVEVNWREWEVRPTVVRNNLAIDAVGMGDSASVQAMVCRPTHMPTGHTAFLVRLRKCASDAAKAVQE